MKRLLIILPIILTLVACDKQKSESAPTPQVGLPLQQNAELVSLSTESLQNMASQPKLLKLTNLTKCAVKGVKDAFVIDGTYAYQKPDHSVGDDMTFVADYKQGDSQLSNIETDEHFLAIAQKHKKSSVEGTVAFSDLYMKRKANTDDASCVDISVDDKK